MVPKNKIKITFVVTNFKMPKNIATKYAAKCLLASINAKASVKIACLVYYTLPAKSKFNKNYFADILFSKSAVSLFRFAIKI